jgi:bacteriocin-like protein
MKKLDNKQLQAIKGGAKIIIVDDDGLPTP